MAAVTDLSMEELTKLRSKIRCINPVALKRDVAAAVVQEAGQGKELKQASSPSCSLSSPKLGYEDTVMSETTVFLLMDSFPRADCCDQVTRQLETSLYKFL